MQTKNSYDQNFIFSENGDTTSADKARDIRNERMWETADESYATLADYIGVSDISDINDEIIPVNLEMFYRNSGGECDTISVPIFNDELILFTGSTRNFNIVATRARTNIFQPEDTYCKLFDRASIFTDSLVRSGVGVALLPIKSDRAKKNEESVIKRETDTKLSSIIGKSIPGFYKGIDRQRIHDIADFCGCSVDVVSFFIPGQSCIELDSEFCTMAMMLISLMFRRLALRRGFNFRTDIKNYTPYFTFNALMYRSERWRYAKSEAEAKAMKTADLGPVHIPELRALYQCAANCGIAITAAFIDEDTDEESDVRLAIRFCPLLNPYSFDRHLHRETAAERQKYVERRKAIIRAIPFDTSGKY